MKATGIVRRIDAGVIITPKSKKLHKYWVFADFRPTKFAKNRFNCFFHQKSEV